MNKPEKTEQTEILALQAPGEIPPQPVSTEPRKLPARVILRSLDDVFHVGRTADTIAELEHAGELARHALGVAERSNAPEAKGLGTLVASLEYKIEACAKTGAESYSAAAAILATEA